MLERGERERDRGETWEEGGLRSEEGGDGEEHVLHMNIIQKQI